MPRMYSVYDAKAKFSEIIRQVREGRTVTVSYHGEPVAEIRPLAAPTAGIAGRLYELADRGVLERGVVAECRLKKVVKRSGALRRFLDERDG